MTVYVLLNMIQRNDDQILTAQNSEAAQGFTAERVLRTRPKTYRAIVQLLADPHASVNQIAKFHRVSTHTVRAIRAREAKTIAELKQRLISIFGNVAEMSAERMEQLCGKANLRDAGISAGIATDKMLALTGQMPAVNIANIWMPSEEEREEMRQTDRKLDEITARLRALDEASSKPS
jgi:transposase-like protein